MKMTEQIEQWGVAGNNMDVIINETKQFVDSYATFDWDKSELSGKLSENISQISESLKSDRQFVQSLCDLLNNYETKEDEIYKSLELLAAEVWITKINDGKWNVDSHEWQEKTKIEMPIFDMKWELNGIEVVKDGEKPSQDFRNGLIKDKPNDWESTDKDLRLFETIEDINNLNSRVELLLNDDKLVDKWDISKTKVLLDNIKKVINHTTPENVKKLQKYIYDNLDDGDFKNEFAAKNHMATGWDWLFGRSTLKWLDDVVWKFEKYVVDMENYVKSQTESGSWDNNGKEGTDLNKSNWWDDWWDESEWGSGVNNPENGSEEPLKLNNKTYSPAQNSWALIQSCWLNGAKFYSYPSVEDSNDLDSSLDTDTKSLDKNKDTEYLMEYNGNVYRVKFDSNWKLKPTALNHKSEVKVLFENNKSCVEYLEWKLPEQIRNDCNIAWNGSNYAIRYKGSSKWLIILPSTIDWEWIWKDLTESLTLLHFMNFLLKENQIDDVSFENDSPDLKMIGNDLCVKVRGWDKGKWYPLPIESFALSWISPDDMKAFINFNNKDGRKDRSPLARSNMIYKKIRLQ